MMAELAQSGQIDELQAMMAQIQYQMDTISVQEPGGTGGSESAWVDYTQIEGYAPGDPSMMAVMVDDFGGRPLDQLAAHYRRVQEEYEAMTAGQGPVLGLESGDDGPTPHELGANISASSPLR